MMLKRFWSLLLIVMSAACGGSYNETVSLVGGSDVGNPGYSELRFLMNSEPQGFEASSAELWIESLSFQGCETSADIQVMDDAVVDLISGSDSGVDLSAADFADACGMAMKIGSLNFTFISSSEKFEIELVGLEGVVRKLNKSVRFNQEGGVHLLLMLDLATLFEGVELQGLSTVDGVIVISKDSNREVYQRMLKSLRRSFNLHEDKNRNHALDLEDGSDLFIKE